MKNIITVLFTVLILAASGQPGTFAWKYQKGYLSKAEEKTLCCPCSQGKLDSLIWYSAKKGITQRVDRQYFLIGKWDNGYSPLNEGDVATLVSMVPERPKYPEALNDPNLWLYPNEYVEKLNSDYHQALLQWTELQNQFAVYVSQNYVVFKARFVLSVCDQYKIGSMSCVWLPYEGDLKQKYLLKFYSILSGKLTTLQDITTKLKTPTKLQ